MHLPPRSVVLLVVLLCAAVPQSARGQVTPLRPPSPPPPRPPPPRPPPSPPPSPPPATASEQECLSAIASDKAAAVAAGVSAALSDATCNTCRYSTLGCPMGMNNITHRVVFATFAPALTCKPGGLDRFDPATGVLVTYCREDMAVGATLAMALAPIFVMLLMCAAAVFFLPCIQRRLGTARAAEAAKIPETGLVVMTNAQHPSPQKMEQEPGCCSAPFETKTRMHELPSYDISNYSAAERERIAFCIEQYVVMLTHPPYNPLVEPRCCLSWLASAAMRPSWGCLTGTISWLIIAVLDSLGAALRILCCCCTAAPSWHHTDALLKDMWFYFKQHHSLLCIMPYLRHPLHPVPRRVHVVSFMTEALFAYFISYVLEMSDVGAEGNPDYVFECGPNCDPEVRAVATAGYGHTLDGDNAGTSTYPASIVAIGIISALFNTPWKQTQALMTKCTCFFCCHPRSRFRLCLEGCGFRLWSIVGLPISVLLFVMAIEGARNPNLTALKWIINLLCAQLGFDNIWTAVAFLRAYRAELLEESKEHQPDAPPAPRADVENPLYAGGKPAARAGLMELNQIK